MPGVFDFSILTS